MFAKPPPDSTVPVYLINVNTPVFKPNAPTLMTIPLPGTVSAPVALIAGKDGLALTLPKFKLFVALFCRVRLFTGKDEPLDKSTVSAALLTLRLPAGDGVTWPDGTLKPPPDTNVSPVYV